MQTYRWPDGSVIRSRQSSSGLVMSRQTLEGAGILFRINRWLTRIRSVF